MNSSKNFILITAGDPASISTEITIKAIESKKRNQNIKSIVITDPNLVEENKALLKSNIKIHEISDIVNFADYKDGYFNIIALKLNNKINFGKPNIKNFSFIRSSITTATDVYFKSVASAIVTNPINKYMMHEAGFNFEGHTDFLATLSSKKNKPVMMLVTSELKTLPLTIHVPLKKVPNLITKDLIWSNVIIAAEALKTYFNIKRPSIIVTGLNPHAGENGDFGDEEINIIKPAIDELRKLDNMCLSGPISADTAFSLLKRTKYDLAVCMYHDQALIPIKTLNFNNGVNVTLGLDFIRTSPDHGTGFDIAGKNMANPESLIAAVNLAYDMCVNKKNAK